MAWIQFTIWFGIHSILDWGHTAWELCIRSIGFGRQDMDCITQQRKQGNGFRVLWGGDTDGYCGKTILFVEMDGI